MKYSLVISNFLGEISSLSHSIILLYFFALITEEGFLFSPCSSLVLCIQMSISFLFSFVFNLSSFSDICNASSDNHFAFSFLGDRLDHCLLYNVTNLHPQALCLSDLILWIYLSLQLYKHKGFDLGHTSYLNGLVVFPTFFNLSLNLSLRSSWSESQSAPGLVFADCIELPHLWL